MQSIQLTSCKLVCKRKTNKQIAYYMKVIPAKLEMNCHCTSVKEDIYPAQTWIPAQLYTKVSCEPQANSSSAAIVVPNYCAAELHDRSSPPISIVSPQLSKYYLVPQINEHVDHQWFASVAVHDAWAQSLPR